jgi:AcrR family transcriptional regulator
MMPRTAEANQHIREAQRARLLDAAGRAFARKGRATTMADIAEAAGVSQGLAYRYFPSKDALLTEVLTHGAQNRLAVIQRILSRPGTPGERLEFLISRSLENMRGQPEYYQLSAQAFDEESLPEDLRQLVHHQVQAYQGALRQLIVEGQAAGEVAAGDPDQLVMVLTLILRGLSQLALRQPEQFKQHFPEARIVLRVLKPEVGARETH